MTIIRIDDKKGLAYLDTIEDMPNDVSVRFVDEIQNAVERFLKVEGLKSAITNEEFAKTL